MTDRELPRNPNNCQTCDHRKHPDGGWCYMFRDEPTEICGQHTLLISSLPDEFMRMFFSTEEQR